MAMSGRLLLSRRFAPLFWCQFFAAFNDNFLKNALVLLILFKIGGAWGESLVTLAGALFIAPYFILSALGGQLADKFDKARVAQRLKLVEIGAAFVAVAGFQLASVPVLFCALVLFGVLGALFGPVKYGVLPDHLSVEELPSGNAFVEGATFLAILSGTIAGGLAMQGGGNALVSSLGVIAVAVASFAASLLIPPTARAAPGLALDANVLRSTVSLLHELWRETPLWRIAVTASTFWLAGAVTISLVAPFVARNLHGSELVVTIHFAVLAIAIAAGSGLAALMLGGRIDMAPAAIGALVIAAASADLGLAFLRTQPGEAVGALAPAEFFAEPGALRASVDLALLAGAGGLMIVPSLAGIQALAKPFARARAVAAVNVLDAAFMTLGTSLVAALQGAGVSVPVLFLGLAAGALVSALWIYKALVAPGARR